MLSVAYLFQPLLCDTRLTRLTLIYFIALFSKNNTPRISEMNMPTFHSSTSCIIFKNCDKQKQIQCCKHKGENYLIFNYFDIIKTGTNLYESFCYFIFKHSNMTVRSILEKIFEIIFRTLTKQSIYEEVCYLAGVRRAGLLNACVKVYSCDKID